MPGASGLSARGAAEKAFKSQFQFNQFDMKPCDPPFSYSIDSWKEQMKVFGNITAKEGFIIPNITQAADETHTVTVKAGIQKLSKLIEGRRQIESLPTSESKSPGMWTRAWSWMRSWVRS